MKIYTVMLSWTVSHTVSCHKSSCCPDRRQRLWATAVNQLQLLQRTCLVITWKTGFV